MKRLKMRPHEVAYYLLLKKRIKTPVQASISTNTASKPVFDAQQVRLDLKPYFATSDAEGFKAIGKDYAVIFICMLFTYLILYIINLPMVVELPIIIILQVIVAGCIRGFVNLTHEASHRTLFATKELNIKLQFLFSFPALRDVRTYEIWHKKHHKHVNTENDPEWEYRKRFLIDENIRRNYRQIFIYRPLLLYYTCDFVKYIMLPFIESRVVRRSKIIYWFIIVCLLSVFNGWLVFLIAYFIPLFIFYPIIGAFIEGSEHTGLKGKATEIGAGRNRFYNPIIEFVLLRHNDGPHDLHHWEVRIPGHRLKAAYKFLKDKYGLPFIEATSLRSTIKQMLDK